MYEQIKSRRALWSFFSGCRAGLGLLLAGLFSLLPQLLQAETRSLKIYYIHTREKAEIIYKKDGRYVESGLKKLNHLLRDWRRNEPTNMDPRLFDLVWQVYKLSGSHDYIHVVSAYRSPKTNNMLRSRSANSGVAKNSQHTLGKALDFYLPDVNLAKLHKIGLHQEGGGVGYYPTSGSPFIHMDVGSVRHWPRMDRRELMALFPDGKTIHVPRDGKPLEGYSQAMAAYNARKGALPPIAVAKDGKKDKKTEKKGLFAGLFGKKKNKNGQTEQMLAAAPSSVPASPSALVNTYDPVDEQIILPETNAPIPTASPFKQARPAKEAEDDVIAAILVADSSVSPPEIMAENTAVSEPGFIPVPILKTPVQVHSSLSGKDVAIALRPNISKQDDMAAILLLERPEGTGTPSPSQMAYMPTLSQSALPPVRIMPGTVLEKASKSEQEQENQIRKDLLGKEPEEPLIAHGMDIIPIPDEYLHDNGRQDLMIVGNGATQTDGGEEKKSDLDALDIDVLDGDTIRTIIAEAMADQQMVASITRTTPKSDKPRLDELGQLITQDEVRRSTTAGIQSLSASDEIRQIPDFVFVSSLQKDRKKHQPVAILGGKAINFPPVARISVSD